MVFLSFSASRRALLFNDVTTIILWFVFAVSCCDSIEHWPDKSKFYRGGGLLGSAKVEYSAIDGSTPSRNDHNDVQEKFFEQRLDHLSDSWSSRGKIFQQRYFSSERYVIFPANGNPHQTETFMDEQEDLPTYAFLCVGGEGPSLDSSVLVDSVHCTGDMIALAKILHLEKKASVYLFAIEHRYYGKSTPAVANPPAVDDIPSVTANPFQRSQYYEYLSSRQALADIASFIEYKNRVLPHNTKWVTFGGSYPGMLSGWARYSFPHLIHAAVSSSAPMQAIVNFFRYMDAVAFELSYEKIGGSRACLEIIQQGHKSLVDMLSLSNHRNDAVQQRIREYVASLFNITGGPDSLLVQRNLELFMGDGVIDVPFQDNDPSCTQSLCNFEKICSAVLNNSMKGLHPVENLANIHGQQHEGEGIDISWENYLDRYYLGNNTDPNDIAWDWQFCTEFGFFQTCPKNSNCPFARGYHPMSEEMEICKLLFDISLKETQQSVNDVLNWFGGWNISGSRILFVNGDADPWSQQAVTPDHGTKSTLLQPTIMVKGASHHTWTHPVKETDTMEVHAAREVIHHTVSAWLRMDEEESEFSQLQLKTFSPPFQKVTKI